MCIRDSHGIVKDYIKIEYAKGDVLYVPVTQLDMDAKYIGPSENSRVRPVSYTHLDVYKRQGYYSYKARLF